MQRIQVWEGGGVGEGGCCGGGVWVDVCGVCIGVGGYVGSAVFLFVCLFFPRRRVLSRVECCIGDI